MTYEISPLLLPIHDDAVAFDILYYQHSRFQERPLPSTITAGTASPPALARRSLYLIFAQQQQPIASRKSRHEQSCFPNTDLHMTRFSLSLSTALIESVVLWWVKEGLASPVLETPLHPRALMSQFYEPA